MPPHSRRLGNVLVMTPASCARYHHTRALRARCDSVHELNFIETCRRLGIVETLALIARIAAEKKIDVFFITLYADSFLVPLEFLRALRKNVKIVLVACDDESAFDVHSRYYAQAVDAVLTTDHFSVDAYRKLGVPAVLCLTSVSAGMYPALDVTRDIDVSFVGNCLKSDRKEYLDFLSANGIPVESFGFGSRGGFVSDAEMAAVFCRSKINLNFSRLEDGSSEAGRTRGHKGRVIEVAMTRSFCLSEHYPALPHIFEIGEEIDCFTDRESLLEKIRYYLSHDEERERISQRAYERTLGEYEDGPYFDKVLSELDPVFLSPSADAARSPVLLKSRDFKKSHVADLFVHGLSLLMRGRIGACVKIAPDLFQYGPGIFLAGAAAGAGRGLGILRRKVA